MMRFVTIVALFLCMCSCASKKHTAFEVTPNMESAVDKWMEQNVNVSPQPLLDENTFKIDIYSKDETYGYTEENPVKVGGVSIGPRYERMFLNALSGPNGEPITYERLGSCCMFDLQGREYAGLLDIYEIMYAGLKEPIILYLNMYEYEELMIPVGFKKKQINDYQPPQFAELTNL